MWGEDEGDGRAQLILVGALALAVVLVAIALVLNGSIYAENLATRQSVDSGEAVELPTDVNQTAKSAISAINVENADNASDHGALETELDQRMADWRRMVRDQYSMSGRWLSAERTGTVRGFRLVQTNHERNYTAGGTLAHQHDWRLAGNVEQMGVFELNVSRSALYDAGYQTTQAALANSSYHIAIKEPGASGDGFWRIYIFQGVGTQNVYLLTETPSQNFQGSTSAYINFASGSCSYQTLEWVEAEIRAGTFGGAPCEELGFIENLSPDYDIYYNNTAATDPVSGDNVNRSKGTYEIFVGKADVPADPYNQGSTGESPYRLAALYSADYEISYESDGVEYSGRVHPIPDRIGTADQSVPTVSFTYTYDSSNTEFDVDWDVSDADGDLDNVDLYLYSNSTQTQLDKVENVPVSGSSDGGATTLDIGTLDGLVSGNEYDIVVVVTDETGASDSELKTYEA